MGSSQFSHSLCRHPDTHQSGDFGPTGTGRMGVWKQAQVDYSPSMELAHKAPEGAGSSFIAPGNQASIHRLNHSAHLR